VAVVDGGGGAGSVGKSVDEPDDAGTGDGGAIKITPLSLSFNSLSKAFFSLF
jgi:hypothetical protein